MGLEWLFAWLAKPKDEQDSSMTSSLYMKFSRMVEYEGTDPFFQV